jgi:hypothetical protein
MGFAAVDVQDMPLEEAVDVDVQVGVGVHVGVGIDVQLVVGEGSVWGRSDDEALMVVLVLAAVTSAETALVVSAGRLMTVAMGKAPMIDRNAHRRTRTVVKWRTWLKGMKPVYESKTGRSLGEN